MSDGVKISLSSDDADFIVSRLEWLKGLYEFHGDRGIAPKNQCESIIEAIKQQREQR